MKNSINLVSKKKAPSKFHKRYFIGSIIFFSVIFLVSAGLISYRLYLSNNLANLKSEEAQLINRVNSNPEKKVRFLTVRERLTEIQNVLSQRKNINAKLESVSSTLPFDVGISLLEGDEEEVRLRVEAESLSSINDLIEQRINEYANEQSRGIQRVEMTSFRLNTESLLYEATFNIVFI